MFAYYKKYAPYLFLLPATIVLILFFFIPFIETVVLSFRDYSTNLYAPNFVGLDNYVALLKSKEFYLVIWNTFLYVVGAVPILATVPLVLAILINQKIRCLNLYKILIKYILIYPYSVIVTKYFSSVFIINIQSSSK